MKVYLIVIIVVLRIRRGDKISTRIKVGDMVVFDCEVIGEFKSKIFWLLFFNDMILFFKDRFIFYVNGFLFINKVNLFDFGEYVCVVRNFSGDDIKMYKLDVVFRFLLINGLYINKIVIKVIVVRYFKKYFDCRVEGTLFFKIMWIVSDNFFFIVLYYGSRIIVYRNGILEIRNVRFLDIVDFICVVRNEGGESVLVV